MARQRDTSASVISKNAIFSSGKNHLVENASHELIAFNSAHVEPADKFWLQTASLLWSVDIT